MKRRARGSVTCALIAAVLLGAFVPLATGQTGGPQPTAAQLQSEVSVATSSRAYASGLLSAASAHGLNVSSEESLIASGNASLLAAQGQLAAGGDIAAGVNDAIAAMGDYSTASAALSALLQQSGLAASADLVGAKGAVESVNATESVLSAIMVEACSGTSVNSTSGTFSQDCTAGGEEIAASAAALSKASTALAAVESGEPGANVSTVAAFVAQARGNLSQAASVVAELSSYTYTTRAQSFVRGPIASEMALANASIAAEQSLFARYDSLVSSFNSTSAGIESGVSGVTSAALTVSSDISSVSFASLSSSISAQEATLASVRSNLTLLEGQLPATLPLGVTTTLQADISSAQSALSAYHSALQASATEAGAFPQVVVSGVAVYSGSFQGGAATAAQESQAFLSSYSSLQTEVALVASEFPLLTVMAQWNATLSGLGQKATSGSGSVSVALQAAASTLSTLESDASSLTSAVQSSKVEVSSGLVQNMTTVSSSESVYLNSTGASTVGKAEASLQSTAGAAGNFTAASQALIQLQIGQFGSAAQDIGTQGSSLRAQVAATSEAMKSVSAAISADLQVRTEAEASAQSLVAQAIVLFGEQQVVQGASLMAQATVQLQVAYARPA